MLNYNNQFVVCIFRMYSILFNTKPPFLNTLYEGHTDVQINKVCICQHYLCLCTKKVNILLSAFSFFPLNLLLSAAQCYVQRHVRIFYVVLLHQHPEAYNNNRNKHNIYIFTCNFVTVIFRTCNNEGNQIPVHQQPACMQSNSKEKL